MEELVKQKIEELARKETMYQLIIAAMGVLFVVGMMAKHFKTIVDSWPSIRKALQYVQKKVLSESIRHKDTMAKLDNIQLLIHLQDKKIESIQNEVQYNGGKVVLSSAVKRIEDSVTVLKESVEYNKQVRNVSDKCSDRMIFKTSAKGACTEMNDAFLKFFGWQESDVLGFAFENIVHDDDVMDMRHKWKTAINNQTAFKDEQRIRDSDGKFHECIVIAHPIIVGEQLIEFSGVIEVKK